MRFVDLFLRFVEQTTKLAELGFYDTENIPHLGRALLDSESAEAHLQTVQ